MHNKIRGEAFEELIANGFIASGFNVGKSNQLPEQHWWDIKVNGTPIEIKSCQITKKNGITKGIRRHHLAKFDYKNKQNLITLKEAKGWIIFIIYYEDQYMILGAIEATEIKPNQERYALTYIMEKKPIKIEELMRKLHAQEITA